MNNLFSLEQKTAIVTGAGRGLGQAIALALAHAGADIAAADVIAVNETIEKVKKTGRKAKGFHVDVSSKESVDRLADDVAKEFGRVDILVNNAGILRIGDAQSLSLDDWNAVINVNLTGQFLCSQAVGRHMIAQKGGRIINIASIAGLFGSPTAAAYCASKAGVILLTKALAVEWGKYNILVNAICPGIFATDMTDEMIESPHYKQMINTRVALGRYAMPDELGGAAVFLSSQASSYMTGASIVVDGGWTSGL